MVARVLFGWVTLSALAGLASACQCSKKNPGVSEAEGDARAQFKGSNETPLPSSDSTKSSGASAALDLGTLPLDAGVRAPFFWVTSGISTFDYRSFIWNPASRSWTAERGFVYPGPSGRVEIRVDVEGWKSLPCTMRDDLRPGTRATLRLVRDGKSVDLIREEEGGDREWASDRFRIDLVASVDRYLFVRTTHEYACGPSPSKEDRVLIVDLDRETLFDFAALLPEQPDLKTTAFERLKRDRESAFPGEPYTLDDVKRVAIFPKYLENDARTLVLESYYTAWVPRSSEDREWGHSSLLTRVKTPLPAWAKQPSEEVLQAIRRRADQTGAEKMTSMVLRGWR